MSDTALTALVTGGTAVLSGALGYATARGQQLIERARIRSEEQRARDEYTNASKERDADAVRELSGRRQILYLEYLRSLDEYVLMVSDPDVNPGGFRDWWSRFQALDNQMDLYGADVVVEANRAVYAELAAVSAALRSTEAFAADVRRLFGQHRGEFEQERSRLVEAMRTEVLTRAV